MHVGMCVSMYTHTYVCACVCVCVCVTSKVPIKIEEKLGSPIQSAQHFRTANSTTLLFLLQ